ncbi:hypothetical protein QUF74_00115 [Candidatus Halobeggiatoa sp. HSG11]|nr:hypothetical protein [Candidatus Halobeggiatoa sp. HSG11]
MLPNDAVNPSIPRKIDEPKEWLLWIHLNEYVKLKDEQVMRMRFRDNLLYVTLAAFGGILSYSITSPSHYHVFLVLPWVCLILGWTYLVNDEKISAIGRYIRYDMTDKLEKLVNENLIDEISEPLFGWETGHRSDNWRKIRKKTQLFIDEVTFCLSGLFSLLLFWDLWSKSWDYLLIFVFIIEIILLCGLGIFIFKYADLKKGR